MSADDKHRSEGHEDDDTLGGSGNGDKGESITAPLAGRTVEEWAATLRPTAKAFSNSPLFQAMKALQDEVEKLRSVVKQAPNPQSLFSPDIILEDSPLDGPYTLNCVRHLKHFLQLESSYMPRTIGKSGSLTKDGKIDFDYFISRSELLDEFGDEGTFLHHLKECSSAYDKSLAAVEDESQKSAPFFRDYNLQRENVENARAALADELSRAPASFDTLRSELDSCAKQALREGYARTIKNHQEIRKSRAREIIAEKAPKAIPKTTEEIAKNFATKTKEELNQNHSKTIREKFGSCLIKIINEPGFGEMDCSSALSDQEIQIEVDKLTDVHFEALQREIEQLRQTHLKQFQPRVGRAESIKSMEIEPKPRPQRSPIPKKGEHRKGHPLE